jgi:hypothetical protein
MVAQDRVMIWNDPWIDVATSSPEEGVAPFNTTLPPPRPTLPPDLRFDCCLASSLSDSELSVWRNLVGTRWPLSGLRDRLEDAWIARIHVAEQVVSTCILRRSEDPTWILETLVAKPTGHGYATALVRSVMTWIYDRGGPLVLAYTWELSLAQLVWAKWRGWLKSAASVEYGWIWTAPGECQFCGTNTAHAVGPAELRVIGDQVIMSDSGLGDGLGYVLGISEEAKTIDWTAVAKTGGWRALWYRGLGPPTPATGWSWTGEFVVVGLLNYDGRAKIPTRWITAEIAPGSLREQA